MNLFSKESKFYGVGIVVVSALMLLFGSCTEVDNNLGSSIVPPGQRFEVGFATLNQGIEGYLTASDSISTGTLDYAYMGKLTEPYYGAVTRATALVQFGFNVRTDTVAYENRISVPDSLALIVGMKTLGGDTLKEQSFDVYRIRKKLYRDSLYYGGINYKEYIDSRPMYNFTFSGKPNGANSFDTLSLRVADAALAEEFMGDLWADTALYKSDTLLMEKLGGLCITPSGSSPDDAAIYGINLQWSTDEGPASYLIAYGHEYEKGNDPSIVEDDVMRAFTISNNTAYTQLRAVTAVENDYSATSFASSINYDVPEDKPLENAISEGYVQGVLGVTTTLLLDDDFISSLRALVPEGKKIFINKAEVTVPLAEKDYTYYDYAPERVGAYVNYPKLQAIADYGYYYEANNDTELAYGGYLNRTKGCYTMDMSLHLQQLLQDESNQMSRRVTLGMGAYDFMKEAMVKLDVGGVEVEVTYTIIGQ